jgi:hypothetical protein
MRRNMVKRTLSAAVLTAAGAALIGGALATAPSGQAAPGGDAQPPCLAEHTCALLVPMGAQGQPAEGQATYLPLTPESSAPRYAPLTPTH